MTETKAFHLAVKGGHQNEELGMAPEQRIQRLTPRISSTLVESWVP